MSLLLLIHLFALLLSATYASPYGCPHLNRRINGPPRVNLSYNGPTGKYYATLYQSGPSSREDYIIRFKPESEGLKVSNTHVGL